MFTLLSINLDGWGRVSSVQVVVSVEMELQVDAEQKPSVFQGHVVQSSGEERWVGREPWWCWLVCVCVCVCVCVW